jgi:hypothetical protein
MPPRYIRLTYPPGAAAALPDDPERFIVGGGGGKGKTGVPNRVTLLKLGDIKLTEEVSHAQRTTRHSKHPRPRTL